MLFIRINIQKDSRIEHVKAETLQLSDEQLSKVYGGDYLLTDEMIKSGDYFIEGHSIEYNGKIYCINKDLTIESAF